MFKRCRGEKNHPFKTKILALLSLYYNCYRNNGKKVMCYYVLG